MTRVSTYLNFQGQTEKAFACYAKTFGTQITMLSRYSDLPAAGPGELPAEEQNLVMHAELPIIGGHVLMATDMLRSIGQQTRIGGAVVGGPARGAGAVRGGGRGLGERYGAGAGVAGVFVGHAVPGGRGPMAGRRGGAGRERGVLAGGGAAGRRGAAAGH